VKIDLDYKFKQDIYLINDGEQVIYKLHRIILPPKGRVVLELFSPLGDIIEADEEYCSKEKILVFDKPVD